jgi:predicted GNAT family N-acyltransferase
MELIEFEALTPERRAELEGDEPDPFGVGDVKLSFQPKERHVGLQDRDGTLVASTGLVVADAQVEEDRFPVVGIGGVIVRTPFRGRGLAREIVEAAIVRAARLGPRFALLFCRQDRAGLYRRLSFIEVSDPVLVRQPVGYQVMPMRTMWRALQPGLTWPAGRLVLHSLPF